MVQWPAGGWEGDEWRQSACVSCAYVGQACLPSKPQPPAGELQWLALRSPAEHCGSAPEGRTATSAPAHATGQQGRHQLRRRHKHAVWDFTHWQPLAHSLLLTATGEYRPWPKANELADQSGSERLRWYCTFCLSCGGTMRMLSPARPNPALPARPHICL